MSLILDLENVADLKPGDLIFCPDETNHLSTWLVISMLQYFNKVNLTFMSSKGYISHSEWSANSGNLKWKIVRNETSFIE